MGASSAGQYDAGLRGWTKYLITRDPTNKNTQRGYDTVRAQINTVPESCTFKSKSQCAAAVCSFPVEFDQPD